MFPDRSVTYVPGLYLPIGQPTLPRLRAGHFIMTREPPGHRALHSLRHIDHLSTQPSYTRGGPHE